jgi:hypothetical protein
MRTLMAKRSFSGKRVAFGAVGMGALAIGALAIRALALKRGKTGHLGIEGRILRKKRDVREGMLKGRLPCLSFGDGPPLVVFPGLGMTNANPTGLQRWGELRLLAPLARAFTVYRVGCRVGLEPGTTMTDLTNDYAEALEDKFRGPVATCSASLRAAL